MQGASMTDDPAINPQALSKTVRGNLRDGIIAGMFDADLACVPRNISFRPGQKLPRLMNQIVGQKLSYLTPPGSMVRQVLHNVHLAYADEIAPVSLLLRGKSCVPRHIRKCEWHITAMRFSTLHVKA